LIEGKLAAVATSAEVYANDLESEIAAVIETAEDAKVRKRRVARLYIYLSTKKPYMDIFRRPLEWKMYVFRPLGTCVHFMAIMYFTATWYSFFILVCCIKKCPANLVKRNKKLGTKKLLRILFCLQPLVANYKKTNISNKTSD
jgi:ABC-type anion transport system duplicated permease subunit